jgi:hypothetical protein
MGGELTVSSELGKGSTFTIHLPAGPSFAEAASHSEELLQARPAIADDRSQ